MTGHESTILGYADDASFVTEAAAFGLVAVGPSPRGGSFLVREQTGKVWLFGRMRRRHGRTIVPSAWTELNVSVMKGIDR